MTTFGWDMSHYDAPSIGGALDEGITFVTHKAGGDANDQELAAWWSGVKGRRITGADVTSGSYSGKALLGAYWVLYPGGPSARADAFLARLDSQCPGWRDGPFLLQVDCEKWNGDPTTVPPTSDINAFCNRLVARMPKLRPVGYLPNWVYGSAVSAFSYPLWASAYVTGSGGFKALYPGDGSSRWASYGGRTPMILQYTSSATIGGQTTCDANAYRGTIADLVAAVAPGWKAPEEDPDVNLTDKYGDAAYAGRTVQDRLKDDAKLRDVWWGDKNGVAAANLPANSPLAKLIALPDQVAAMNTALTAAINALAQYNHVDPAALGAAIAPGVAAAIIAQLPDIADPVSQTEVTTAVEAAFARAFGGGTNGS